MTSENKEHCFFSFHFSHEITFKLDGYIIRSSNRYFPKEWGLIGISTENESIIQKTSSESSMSSPYAEALVKVSNTISSKNGFKIIQLTENSEGTHNFSLSGLEFYGTLTTFELKSKIK